MYESYWQLREKPFEPGADGEFYYPAQTHQAALLKLRYAIENRRAAALLAGASGLGKTLVAGMIRSALDESFQPFVQLSFPQMPVDQLMAYLAAWLTGGEVNGPLWQNVDRIERFLAENTNKGRHAVLVIDEANGAPVQGVKVVVEHSGGSTTEETDATGVVDLASVTTNPTAVHAFHSDYSWVSVVDPGSKDVLVSISPRPDTTKAGGFRGQFDFSKIPTPGEVQLGIAEG